MHTCFAAQFAITARTPTGDQPDVDNEHRSLFQTQYHEQGYDSVRLKLAFRFSRTADVRTAAANVRTELQMARAPVPTQYYTPLTAL